MSRSPLQGRVEEIIIREPKPSWGSRVGDVLGDVFSGIGAAVREYGPAVLQGLANASSLYSNSSSAYQPYDISPSSLPDYSSSSRTVRITPPEPIRPRHLPEPRQAPRLMETYGAKLQQQQRQEQQRLQEMLRSNEQAANRRGIAGALSQHHQLGSSYQPERRQSQIDIHPPQTASHSLRNYLNPSTNYVPIQEDYGWIQANLARSGTPVTWQEQMMMQQAQQQAVQQQQTLNAQIQAARAQRELAEAQTRSLREQQYRQPLQGRVTYDTPPAQEFFPASTYRNPSTRETTDLNQKLLEGEVLSDNEMLQLKLDLDILRYSATSDAQKQVVEILEENTQNRIVENILTQAPISEDGMIQVYGMDLHPEEAELAVTLDIEHFWDKEIHLRPEEIQRQLKEFALELWNVAYGEDINTLLDNDAHLLQRVWAGLQFLPALKITKLAKIGKFARFFRKPGNLGANPFKGKTPTQIHKMLTERGINPANPVNASQIGKTNYVHPKSKRAYRIDLKGQGKYPTEPSHVDVMHERETRKLREKMGLSGKRKYWDVKDE
jgi:hypothetical protein